MSCKTCIFLILNPLNAITAALGSSQVQAMKFHTQNYKCRSTTLVEALFA